MSTRRTTNRRLRLTTVAAAAVLVAAACTSSTESGTDPAVDAGSGPSEVESEVATEGIVSALDDRFDDRLPDPLIDPAEILSGGPPPDGIPAIDDPKFQPVDEVDFLSGQEGVLSLTVGQETRAYPLRILMWHEIVNDTVDGVPVAVTYCPLCNSGVAFLRTVDGQVLDFGTSGMLYVDNLVMYDRQSESLWPQLTGQAAVGEMTGTELESIPMGTVSWKEFRQGHPDSLVLTQDTGHDRRYGANPYVGYDDPDGRLLFPLPDDADARLPVKERVIGLSDGDAHVAVVRETLAGAAPFVTDVGGQDLVLWHRAGQASALDGSTTINGKDVGTVGVFEPRAGGRDLTFTRVRSGFRDRQTGSTWNVLGQAVAGPLQGERLPEHEHLDTFWFAWIAFNPDSRVIRVG